MSKILEKLNGIMDQIQAIMESDPRAHIPPSEELLELLRRANIYFAHYCAPVLYENEILMLLEDDKEASLVCRYLAYKKKEDFMFNVCMNEKQTKEQQAGVWDNLRLDERSGKEFELVEISFLYEGELHQMQLSKQERLLMLRKFIPLAKQFVTTGYGAIAPPYKEDRKSVV